MKVLCAIGQHQYGAPLRGVGIEYAAFLPALRRAGHEVHHFELANLAQWGSYAALNRALLEAIDRIRPDILLVVQMYYELWNETLRALQARGDVATISWTTDDSWKYREHSRFIGRYYHAMATTYRDCVADYHRDGIENVLLTQWGVSRDWLQAPLLAKDCKYKVSFIGAAYGRRLKRIRQLRDLGLEVACFGQGWPAGPVATEELPRIMRESVISLNFSDSFKPGPPQVKARAFEAPGAGGFLLTEEAPDLDRAFVPGKEVITYSSLKDLAEKAAYYLAHLAERDKIANAGHERARRDHTYDTRMREVLAFALAAKERWLQAHPRTSAPSFEEACRRHRLTLPLRLLRASLAGAGKLLWGPVRGPRAARRLVYELSWRLAGEKTYSAAGWPGRMFSNL